MAIIPSSLPNTNAADSDYPLGSAKNSSAPGTKDGTAVQAAILNDIWGFCQRLLTEASVTASGDPDTILVSQYFEALLDVVNEEIDTAIGDIPSASTSEEGLIELATDAEVIAGTVTNKAVTPSGLKAKVDGDSGTWTTPTLLNGWTTSEDAVQYRLVQGKKIEIMGKVIPTNATLSTVFNVGSLGLSTMGILFGVAVDSFNGNIELVSLSTNGDIKILSYQTADPSYYFSISLPLDMG